MKKQNGFMLAEGATRTNMLQRVGNGFTLAEVLITLAIIGVVAAMTIPTLIAKINSIVTDNQIKVFNAKLIKGMNLTKTAGDLNNTYTSTYDFLTNGLGKNLKMAKVCDSDHIRDCIPYDKIKYDNSGKEETVDVANLKTAGDLQIKNSNGTNYVDTAAFVLADGTPVIVTYDLNCIDDPDKADTTINKCLAGIYDLNGTRKPNKYGESEVNGKTTHNSDLQPFNGARIANSALATINGVKIMTAPTVPTPVTKATCEELKANGYPINGCYYDIDYWAGAVKTCKDLGSRLPTEAELTKIAQELYNDPSIGNDYNNATLDTSKIPSALSGLGSSWYFLWFSSEYSADYAYCRYFGSSYTFRDEYGCTRDDSTFRAVCVAD